MTWIAASVFALSIYSCVTKKEEITPPSKASSLSVPVNVNKVISASSSEALPVSTPDALDKWRCVNRAGVTYFVRDKPLDDACVPLLENCDKTAAKKIKNAMASLGTTADLGSKLEFHWSPIALTAFTDANAEFGMRSIADADACLLGRAREIRFYRRDNLWAVASPTAGFMMMK
ncbi:hypothetical protein KDM87_06945 [Undibacterium sp. FT147W]|uniref:Lipoprotein n=1 Tax=Undibacterium rivi TaxID=2828729 RepID=A0ABS5H137_9BURK|nr:hypothetical protein [Undibacterium rivi]MBR7792333.1 hypothetical protein [Undibacterium rivi]